MECRDSNQVNWVPCNPIENSHLKEKRKTVIIALRSNHKLQANHEFQARQNQSWLVTTLEHSAALY